MKTKLGPAAVIAAYWTASDRGPSAASFDNFGKGGQALHHQREGEKLQAFSVRGVKE